MSDDEKRAVNNLVRIAREQLAEGEVPAFVREIFHKRLESGDTTLPRTEDGTPYMRFMIQGPADGDALKRWEVVKGVYVCGTAFGTADMTEEQIQQRIREEANRDRNGRQ